MRRRGTFVKRLIGLPGEVLSEDEKGFIWVNHRRLNEPYIKAKRRNEDIENREETWHVPPGSFFFVGDNRGQSCDSRRWGSVPRANLVGPVFATYWPPRRIALHAIFPREALLGVSLLRTRVSVR